MHGQPLASAARSTTAALIAWIAFTATPAMAQIIRPWQVYEIALTAEREHDNPYVAGLPDGGAPYVRATFTAEAGPATGRELTVAGFWDGGRTWRIRFAPPRAGRWRYTTVSADPGLHGATGELAVEPWTDDQKRANPTRRGFIRVNSPDPTARPAALRSGRYFEYADGTPFLWIGDTWWNWTKRDIRFESFQRLADDRAAKGFTVGQLFVAGNGWSRSSSLLDETYQQVDLDLMRRVERMIAYANTGGITVWVHGWWSRPDMDQRIGETNIRRWSRYLVHRLGAYNVIWVLAGEYNMHDYGGLGLDFWRNLGELIDREDPYERIISAHPTPPAWTGGADAPQWSTARVLHDEPWLDYNQSQVGHGRWRNEMIPAVVTAAYAKRPPRPIVVTEPWYEFAPGSASAMDIRFGAWSAVLCGAAGHSYGGGFVWRANLPESPAGGGPWPGEAGFETDTLDYPGAASMKHLGDFLRRLEWWRLEPHPELVREYPQPLCAAIPGREYLVYLRYGGAALIDLRPSSPSDRFDYGFFNPATGEDGPTGTVRGGDLRRLHAPADYPASLETRDWVLRIRRTD